MNLRTGTTRDGRFFCVAESAKHRVWAHGKTEKQALELAFAVCAHMPQDTKRQPALFDLP